MQRSPLDSPTKLSMAKSQDDEDIEQQIQEINKRNKEGDLIKKYDLKGIKIDRNMSYHDPMFSENVTDKWFTKESFIKSMRKKNYF